MINLCTNLKQPRVKNYPCVAFLVKSDKGTVAERSRHRVDENLEIKYRLE